MQTKTTVWAMAMLCVAAMIGCSGKGGANQQMASNPGVTDISIAPTPLAAEPAPQPLAAQPVVSDVPTQAPLAAAPVAPAAMTGGKYTVQKGDTLWKIATTSYGDGKQWQRIASANPGLTPGTLKAGQTIMIP